MRRALTFCTLLGLVAASVGCRGVVTGTHDCTYDPASADMPPLNGRIPFATVGSPVSGAGFIAPPEVPAEEKPVEKKMEKKTEKKDEKKDEKKPEVKDMGK